MGSISERLNEQLSFAASVADDLNAAIANDAFTLEDLSLRIVTNEEHGYLSLESEQMILQDALADAAQAAADELQLETSPVIVYLLNEIWSKDDADLYSMYSVAAGVDPADAAPFGPWEYRWRAADFPLGPNDVLISEWLADDLQVEPGDMIGAKYHVVGDRGELPEDEIEFNVAGIVALTGPVADPGITPLVPGITDAEGYENWREPFPLDRPRITASDHDYWDVHHTTPKVVLSLSAAQELWRSRYGQLTSLRIAPGPDGLEATRIAFEAGTAIAARCDLRQVWRFVPSSNRDSRPPRGRRTSPGCSSASASSSSPRPSCSWR